LDGAAADGVYDNVGATAPFNPAKIIGSIALNVAAPTPSVWSSNWSWRPLPAGLRRVTIYWAGEIFPTAPLAQQARQAVDLRNSFRSAARDAMIDQDTAAQLNATNPNLTWEQVVQKYSADYSGDELWQQIIDASQRSRASVNQSLGVASPGGQ
jgi:hypothetical protein